MELTEERQIVSRSTPVPIPGDGEVRVRIVAVGICGTDIHAYRGRTGVLPLVLGHDAAALVDGIGPAVPAALLIGQRVTIDPSISCGTCAYCLDGRRHLCRSGAYLGMTCAGAMAEYVVVPHERLVALPASVSDRDATVLEPIAVALHLLDRIGDFAPAGMAAHIIGGGPLGILVAQTIAAHGWSPIIHEPLAGRREAAGRLGVTAVVPGDVVDPDHAVLIVETSASPSGIDLALRLAAPGSVIAVVGRTDYRFPSADILVRELSILGVKSGVDCYPRALELVAAGVIRPSAVISHTFGLEEVMTAMETIVGSDAVMRAILFVPPYGSDPSPIAETGT